MIRCDSVIPATIPAGAIALFDAIPSSGWTQYSQQNGYFIQGAVIAGVVVGSNTHAHLVSTNVPSSGVWAPAGPTAVANGAHVHSKTTDTGSSEPPYREVILAKADGETSIPAGMIGMFNELPPACWTVISDIGGDLYHRFIKGSSSYGTTGGTESHSHANLTIDTPPSFPPLYVRTSGLGTNIPVGTVDHTHGGITLSSFNTESHLPLYRDVIFAKLRITTASPSSNSPVCEGSTITLSGSASGGIEPYTWSWSGPGPWSSTAQNPTIPNATTGMTGTYSLTVTDKNGSGCTSNPATTLVTVNAKPIASPSSNSSVCEGSTISLTGSASGGIPPYAYSWSGPNFFSSNQQSPSIPNATLAMAGDYTLTVTDNNTCTSVPSSTIVVVNARPTTSPLSNSPVCEGGTINLSSNASGGRAPYTYRWSGPGPWTSTDQNPTRSNATTAMTGTYSLTVTDNNTCTSIPATTDVTVSPPPSVTCRASTFLSFAGFPVGFSCTPSGGVPPYTFSWNFDDGSSSTVQNPSHIYTGVGTFTARVTVTDSIGCTGTCSTDVTVVPLTSPSEAASLPAALTPPAPSTPRSSPSPPPLIYQRLPPNLMVQLLSVNPQQGYAGRPVTISTNVVNTGDEGGNYNVVLKINGKAEQSKMVSVGPQGTQPVKFTVAKDRPGTYGVAIDSQRSSFTILGADGKSHAPPASRGLIVILVMAILVLATVVVLMLGFRRAA